MSYIKISTLEYPRYEGDIRLEYPNLPFGSGDDFQLPDNYARIDQSNKPQYDHKTQYLVFSTPTQVDGQWFATYEVRDYTQQELDMMKPKKITNRPSVIINPDLNVAGAAPDVIT